MSHPRKIPPGLRSAAPRLLVNKNERYNYANSLIYCSSLGTFDVGELRSLKALRELLMLSETPILQYFMSAFIWRGGEMLL